MSEVFVGIVFIILSFVPLVLSCWFFVEGALWFRKSRKERDITRY